MDDHDEATGGIDVSDDGEQWLVRMWGEVDATLRDLASTAMVRVLERPAPVVVDLREVTFIDSSGLAFVLQLWSVGQEDGTSVVLRDTPATVLDLLEVIGMGGVIPLVWSCGEGPQSVAPERVIV